MTGVHCGVHQDQNFYKLDYRFLIKADMSKVPKKGSLLSFCNILRKSIVTVFVFYCYAKHSDTLEAPSMFVITCFCKYPNCLDFARSVIVCGLLSQCSGLNQFVLAYISHRKKFHICIIFHQQCKTIHL